MHHTPRGTITWNAVQAADDTTKARTGRRAARMVELNNTHRVETRRLGQIISTARHTCSNSNVLGEG